jgi:RNA-directed DNA polymerase
MLPFFVNVYLNEFDHFVQEHLKVSKYLRYVDDFSLFADDRQFLSDARCAIEDYLAQLRLKIHPIKSQLFETRYGANFVGFRVLSLGESVAVARGSKRRAIRIRVRNDNLRRARHRIRRLQHAYAKDQFSLDQLTQRLQSWEAHLKHGDTYQLRRAIFDQLVFCRSH